MSVLDEIIDGVRADLAERQARVSLDELKERAAKAPAAKDGLATIDSFDALAATGAPRKLYVTWHMNEPGNRLIAELVAARLR